MDSYDAIIVGSGPNGLAAAITLARAGLAVLVREAADEPGGGLRTAELTRPGYLHDVCSTVHPLGIGSPFFRMLPLEAHGLRWVQPEHAMAHPLDDGRAAVLDRSLETTVGVLRAGDGDRWRRLFAHPAAHWWELASDALAPLHVPRHPMLFARFGATALPPALYHIRNFADEAARALFAGMALHALVPLDVWGTSAFAMVLGAAGHALGWPVAAGGSREIARVLLRYLESLGGRVEVGAPVQTLAELPRARAVLLDLTPRQVVRIAGDRLPADYVRALTRFRYGPGVFKVDWALSGPVPWRNPACRVAGTVHVGGTAAELARGAREVWGGRHPEQPFAIVVQPSRFDRTRVPDGGETLWAYCHVPNGSRVDMVKRIEAQIERFAPGFRDCIVARHAMDTAALEMHDANLVGGDVGGGANTLDQMFFRPVRRRVPYATPVRGLYLCSASTPPGGGAHGMCGYQAARVVLARELGLVGWWGTDGTALRAAH